MLYEQLAARSRQGRISFAMPGHKGGTWIAPPLHRPLELDITELPGTDNMHHPDGILRDALERIAAAYGAAHSYFSVNGSSAGILAALHFAASRCVKGIVDRNCHISVLNALCLTGLQPVYLQPQLSADVGIPGAISPESIKDALHNHPDAGFVFLTSPNYFGLCSDIARIAEIVHAAGNYLIVDEAHGAHFGFSPLLPQSALQQGADIVIQSAHKTLPAANQCALIHLSGRIDAQEFSRWYSLFQTTSPSYPLMALTEYAVQKVAAHGGQFYQALHECITPLSAPFPLLRTPVGGAADKDFTRLVFHTASQGVRGYDAAAFLDQQGIDVEMADCNNLVCIATGGNAPEDFTALARALAACPSGGAAPLFLPPPPVHCSTLPKEAFDAPSTLYPLEQAAGRICAGCVASYPPGVPILAPGELVGLEHIAYLREILRQGGTVTGLDNGCCRVLL